MEINLKYGEKYGKLSILKEANRRGRYRYFLCKCDCGNEKEIRMQNLRNSTIRSCGCLHKYTKNHKIHGLRKHPLYGVWKGIKERCYDKNHKSYKNYGGRNINMCDEWKNSFIKFYEDMGPTYKKGLTIERINNNKSYCKENCKWILKQYQSKNRRGNIMYQGKCLTDWCKELGLNYETIRQRIKKLNWSIEKALEFNKNNNEILGPYRDLSRF